MVSEFPLKPIKRILKKYYQGEISTDACIYIRDLLLDVTEYLANQGIKEFVEYNCRRQEHNLPVLKRLDKSVFIDISDKIFNAVRNNNIGEVGKCNEILLCQGGNITNKKRKDIIIKDAGVEVV